MLTSIATQARNGLEGLNRVPELAELPRIDAYLRHYAKATPNSEAAWCPHRRLSYLELANNVEQCMRALASAGVTVGDRVSTLSPPNSDFLTTFLATISLGAVWLGLNPRQTRRELEFVLDDARPTVAFVRGRIGERQYTGDLLELGRKTGSQIVGLDAAAAQGGIQSYEDFVSASEQASTDITEPSTDNTGPALLVYTSGSTGTPKGALISQRALVEAARMRLKAWGHDGYRILMNLPISHIGGACDVTCTGLVAGGGIVFLEAFDAQETVRLIDERSVTALYQVPTQLQMLLTAADQMDANLTSLQAICWSGARAPGPLVESLARRFPGKLGTDYSMTESVAPITLTPLMDDTEVLQRTAGWPAMGREVRLDGQSSEVLVRDENLMLGYWKREEETRAAIDQDGWLHTGDIGRFEDDGTLTLIGRTKELFISGGYNIYPAEIESVLEEHDEVAVAAVVPRDDPLWGEVGCAFVAALPGANLTGQELKTYCRSRLANYKIPKQFIIEPELPMLPVGKIDKATLRAKAASPANTKIGN
ncbi:MAG: acyl--CoA ligase [Chromatiales bacterium]|nr:acyl--CoA ligase [Chromatiales bacterium]MYC52197.1 acyl--CoA ligase [Gammaproteobacteria bacterium]